MTSVLRKVGYLVVLLGAVLYAVVALRGPMGVPILIEKRRTVRELQEQNANLVLEIQNRKERIERLRSSETEQEEEIRRRYKLLKPGETTFMLPENFTKAK